MEDRYYCIPDIHGRNDLLQAALKFIYDENPEGCKIIFLGDYIDRGPENLKVLQAVMNPPENYKFVCLKGNHEDMFVDCYFSGREFYHVPTAREIAGLDMNNIPYYGQELRHFISKEIIEWMDGLKLFHFEDDNVFAHAFYDDSVLPEDQHDGTVLWKRMDDWQTFFSKDDRLYLTHGHTPRKHGPVKSPNRVNLDAGAVFYDRLVIGEYCKGMRGPSSFYEFINTNNNGS